MKIVKTLLVAIPLLSVYLSAQCTEEQRSRMIMNNVSDYEIQRQCGNDYSAQQDTYGAQADIYGVQNNTSARSGIELRFGFVSGSGSASWDEDDSTTIFENHDSTDTGIKMQIGYKTVKNSSSSTYSYIGYQSTTYEVDGFSVLGSEADSTMFIIGSESMIGSSPLKFVYGGEFGFVTISYTGVDLTGLSAEPYIGARFEIGNNLNLNAKIGYRAIMANGDYNGYDEQIFDFGLISGFSVGYTF